MELTMKIVDVLNLRVGVEDKTVVSIENINYCIDLKDEASCFYFYDLLEPECEKLNIDFGSLMYCLYIEDIDKSKLYSIDI